MTILTLEASLASTPTAPRPMAWKDGRLNWTSRWKDDRGNRRMKRFGPVDEVTRRAALAAFKLWLRRWTNDERVKNPGNDGDGYTVAQLAEAFHEHAKITFVKRGKATSTAWNVMYAMQALIDLHGPKPAAVIDGPAIAAVRDAMIHRVVKDETVARAVTTINDRLHWIKKAFSFARERDLIPKDNLWDICNVSRLVPGRCDARASVPVLPVDEHWMALTKTKATSVVAAMIDLQWLTGMRPEEVCMMRACDIDMTEAVWLYTPMTHKMEHKQQARVIALGPNCQTIVRRFLARSTDAFLFSPAEARAEQIAARRAARKSKLWPSHVTHQAAKRVEQPQWRAGERYTTQSYRKAIHHACRRLQQDDPHAPQWNPNQLRHAAATRLNRQFGLDDVAVMLGHQDTQTTKIYARPDVQKAVNIAAKVG